MRLVVGLSGASGIVYGVRLLEVLRELGVETHLVATNPAREMLRIETDYDADYVESLATKSYCIDDLAAPISSGSFKTDGMAVAPCSTRTLAGIAHGYSGNLLLRAAEVCLKERRRLVLVPRETPLSPIHMENMLKATRAGATILPAMPAFYHRPKTLEELVDHVVGKVLDAFEIEHHLYARWEGPGSRP